MRASHCVVVAAALSCMVISPIFACAQVVIGRATEYPKFTVRRTFIAEIDYLNLSIWAVIAHRSHEINVHGGLNGDSVRNGGEREPSDHTIPRCGFFFANDKRRDVAGRFFSPNIRAEHFKIMSLAGPAFMECNGPGRPLRWLTPFLFEPSECVNGGEIDDARLLHCGCRPDVSHLSSGSWAWEYRARYREDNCRGLPVIGQGNCDVESVIAANPSRLIMFWLGQEQPRSIQSKQGGFGHSFRMPDCDIHRAQLTPEHDELPNQYDNLSARNQDEINRIISEAIRCANQRPGDGDKVICRYGRPVTGIRRFPVYVQLLFFLLLMCPFCVMVGFGWNYLFDNRWRRGGVLLVAGFGGVISVLGWCAFGNPIEFWGRLWGML
jgi:hypothetical protein